MPKIREKFRKWAIKFTVVHIIIALLLILKPMFPCLPSSANNLIRTVNCFTIESYCLENSTDKSEYVYIGISEQLKRIINPKNHVEKI